MCIVLKARILSCYLLIIRIWISIGKNQKPKTEQRRLDVMEIYRQRLVTTAVAFVQTNICCVF